MKDTVTVSHEAFMISFRHGWDAAMDEVMYIAESAEFKNESVSELIEALRKFRNANR